MEFAADKAAAMCELQGNWKEAVKCHAHRRNRHRNFDRALEILVDKAIFFTDHQAEQLRVEIAKKACHGARYAGELLDLCFLCTLLLNPGNGGN